MNLSNEQVLRYARHILLPDIGGRGQQRLLGAAVEVEVTEGDGAAIAALAYLAAGGIGCLELRGAIDDPVSDADLASGLLYGIADVGRPRFDALRDRLTAINPDVRIERAAPGRRLATRIPASSDEGCRGGRDLAAALVAGGARAVAVLTELARA